MKNDEFLKYIGKDKNGKDVTQDEPVALYLSKPEIVVKGRKVVRAGGKEKEKVKEEE